MPSLYETIGCGVVTAATYAGLHPFVDPAVFLDMGIGAGEMFTILMMVVFGVERLVEVFN